MQTDMAICDRPHHIAVEQQVLEPLTAGDVLVKVAFCGVCPWDLRVFSGLSTSAHYPMRLGHEVSGVVEAVGSRTLAVRPGDRVVVDVVRRCGTCAKCRTGFENHCEKADYSRGGYAGHIMAPIESIYPLRQTTPLIEASLTEPLACVVRGQNRIGVGPEDTVLVVGSGPIGLLHVQALKARRARVLVSDPLAVRLEKARSLGADATINPLRDNLPEVVKAETEGQGVNVAIIATSNIDSIKQILPVLSVGGRLLLFAGFYPEGKMTLDMNAIHYQELLVAGTSDYTRVEFAEALRLIEDKTVRISALISHVYPLQEISQALHTAESQKGLKVVVQCNEVEAFDPGASA